MRYLSSDDLDIAFDIIQKHYAFREKIPHYKSEKEGLGKLRGVLDGVKSDYYPSHYDKAAYLLIQINKGHFFSNGNKRLALVCTLMFVLSNNFSIQALNKSEYEKKLKKLFPSFENYCDYDDFAPEEFGYYNLSIIIAESDKHDNSFEKLKKNVEEFLKFSLFF